MNSVTIRQASLQDAWAILEIYAPYILETNITFEYDVPALSEFEERMRKIMRKYPYLVAVCDGAVVGYAYAHEHMERAAYGWNVETSVYVKMGETGRGIGRGLYRELFDQLQEQNVQNLYACVTLPNGPSERLHRSFGFALVGRFHQTGYKFGKWHDVGWFEKKIGNCETGEALLPVRAKSDFLS